VSPPAFARLRLAAGPLATRRGFLRLAGATAALGALGQLRALPLRAAPPGAPRFFDPGETEILTQLAERIVDSDDPAAPRVRDTAAVAAIDALCGRLDPEIAGQLPLALQLFDWGPWIFDWTPSRFTRMDAAAQDASLRAWLESRLALRRQAFQGIRNLCLFGYYSQPEVWPAIGYQGPLLGKGVFA
jgi:hypothetical protein